MVQVCTFGSSKMQVEEGGTGLVLGTSPPLDRAFCKMYLMGLCRITILRLSESVVEALSLPSTNQIDEPDNNLQARRYTLNPAVSHPQRIP